jgi:hypothetical protein
MTHFISILLFTLFYFTSAAQSEPEIHSFGIKGGLNMANLSGDSEGTESKVDFHVGLFWMIKSSENFRIVPEIMFSRQGAQISGSSNLRINYDYLNVPILFSYFATKQLYFQAGPQAGILFSAKVTSGNGTQDVQSQLKEFDFSLSFGVGGNFGAALISGRVNLGLTNTAKNSDGGKFPNQVFQLSLGFKLSRRY